MKLGMIAATLTLILGAAPSPLAAGEKAPVVLQPASEWSLRATDERCRITRTFGSGADKVLVRIDRFEPSRLVTVLVAGAPLAEVNKMDVSLRFMPNGTSKIERLFGGSVGSYTPGLYTGDIALAPYEAGPDAVNALEVISRARPTIRVELGPMAQPLADLARCSDALPTRWGLDAGQQHALSQYPDAITSPGEWLSTEDYPRALLKQGAQGTVRVRLDVDAAGAATGCHVQEATDPPGFGEAVCAGLMRHAAFKPALDADGKPVASYYVNSVTFDFQPW